MGKWKRPAAQEVQPLQITIVKGMDDDGVYVSEGSAENPLAAAWIAKFHAAKSVIVRNENLLNEYRYNVYRVAEIWEQYESDRPAWDAQHAFIHLAECELVDLMSTGYGYSHHIENLVRKGYDRAMLELSAQLNPTQPANEKDFDNTSGWE